jgi:ribonuclease HI
VPSPSADCSQRYGSSTASDGLSLGGRDKPATMVAFADGACRGNPGHGACGALLVDRSTHTVVASRARYLSDNETNNTAEYQGLLLALELAAELGVPALEVCMDSELIVKQMLGQYRVKAPHLRALFQSSKTRCQSFQRVDFIHVPRTQNVLADRLANEALDQQAADREMDTRETLEVEGR